MGGRVTSSLGAKKCCQKFKKNRKRKKRRTMRLHLPRSPLLLIERPLAASIVCFAYLLSCCWPARHGCPCRAE